MSGGGRLAPSASSNTTASSRQRSHRHYEKFPPAISLFAQTSGRIRHNWCLQRKGYHHHHHQTHKTYGRRLLHQYAYRHRLNDIHKNPRIACTSINNTRSSSVLVNDDDHRLWEAVLSGAICFATISAALVVSNASSSTSGDGYVDDRLCTLLRSLVRTTSLEPPCFGVQDDVLPPGLDVDDSMSDDAVDGNATSDKTTNVLAASASLVFANHDARSRVFSAGAPIKQSRAATEKSNSVSMNEGLYGRRKNYDVSVRSAPPSYSCFEQTASSHQAQRSIILKSVPGFFVALICDRFLYALSKVDESRWRMSSLFRRVAVLPRFSMVTEAVASANS